MINSSISQKLIAVLLGALSCVSCAVKQPADTQLREYVAQKLMLDLRYYCDDELDTSCNTPLTTLPKELSKMISDTGIGGVVLFADNLDNTEQMLRLNYALQQAAQRGGHSPLFIAIDQEGGRVVRIPQNLATSFAGNMAIGATYAQHGDYFARLSGEIIAKELLSLGFNVNFAPTVDVNVNPLNPVINVRSYGEDANIVAELGTAQMAAMQAQGMMATLKHFPGHGDTSVDSHTGLPRVEHGLQQIEASDLLPFQYAIDQNAPAMIMTAHIQYPQLDNTLFTTKEGESTILPATMSRKILTDLLRDKMAFKGLIVTDALDMAGISHFFDKTEAVIQTFAAGADIALMPIAIRRPADIGKLDALIDDVVKAVQTERLDKQEITLSAQRIEQVKNQYQLAQRNTLPLEQAIENAQATLGNARHRQVEQALADSAIVQIKDAGVLPLKQTLKSVYLSMPDTTKCMALTLALTTRLPKVNIQCGSVANGNQGSDFDMREQADVIIAADISPDQSLVELGGMDDIQTWRDRAPKEQQLSQQLALLQAAKAQGKTTIFISLRAPYNVNVFAHYADVILASFAYNSNKVEYMDKSGRLITQFEGAIFNALADVITGNKVATGTLPVTID
ncbi:glycoside hydrolase family 3 protein [Flavobacterium sp. W21_SRS_FM6]|uniref:glycoside hydrolase family 3 protein n=1 Tax=Flavobacterium sp. W21_SRS_FM6 TaxID=3240268 RepID=UPI003F922C6E